MRYMLFVKDIELEISIGIHDFEMKNRQTLLVSVFVYVERPPEDDDIKSAYDYDRIVDYVRSIANRDHIALQETICDAIVQFCRNEDRIVGGLVRTQKPTVYADAASVGCQMTWGDFPIFGISAGSDPV